MAKKIAKKDKQVKLDGRMVSPEYYAKTVGKRQKQAVYKKNNTGYKGANFRSIGTLRRSIFSNILRDARARGEVLRPQPMRRMAKAAIANMREAINRGKGYLSARNSAIRARGGVVG